VLRLELIVTIKGGFSCIVCVGRCERVEIPLYIKPVDGTSKPCLESLVQLPDVLCQEEDDLYHNAKEACGSDLAARVHNAAGRYSLSSFFFLVYFCVAIQSEAVTAFVLSMFLTVLTKTALQMYLMFIFMLFVSFICYYLLLVL